MYELVQLKPIYGQIIVWPRVWREKTKLMVTHGHFCHFLRFVETIGAFPVKALTEFQQRTILMFQKGKGGKPTQARPIRNPLFSEPRSYPNPNGNERERRVSSAPGFSAVAWKNQFCDFEKL
ncbi:hypothetical protein KIL84_017318 [Mauremys mutica]|uniref:Uncharacterized protein n=1 Tax=Mauremys mutica TaxID=74926 RepID=A0A9D3X433_9SAUR|nr:hypothetical protein KIL84_017318 [Mauremys mutica]